MTLLNPCKYGAITGTGNAITVTIGFKPGVVFLYNQTDAGTLWWTNTLADGYGYRSITNGNESVISSNGVTPFQEGFIFGADTEMNVASDEVHWIAWRTE